MVAPGLAWLQCFHKVLANSTILKLLKMSLKEVTAMVSQVERDSLNAVRS